MIFNILLIGDSNSGKAQLMNKFIYDKCEGYSSTTGIEFGNKEIKINNQKILLHILDTAGQEKYRSVAKNFMRKGDGIIFVFDLANRFTFESIKEWLIACEGENEKCEKILVGNQYNLKNREVEKEKVKKFSEKLNIKYFEVNSKDGTNVELIFKEIAGLILSHRPIAHSGRLANKLTEYNRINHKEKNRKVIFNKLLKYMNQ